LKGHLPTFETGFNLAFAGARELTLVATPASLTQCRAYATPNPAPLLLTALGGLNGIQSHNAISTMPEG